MTWKAKGARAPVPFCWWCSRKLHAGGRTWARVRPLVGDAFAHYVHKDCLTQMREQGGGWEVLEETPTKANGGA